MKVNLKKRHNKMVDRIRYPTVSYLPFYYIIFQFLLLTIFNLQANILTTKDILSNLGYTASVSVCIYIGIVFKRWAFMTSHSSDMAFMVSQRQPSTCLGWLAESVTWQSPLGEVGAVKRFYKPEGVAAFVWRT